MTTLRDQLQASLGDAYVIRQELGGAGMSRVFTAEDAVLGRAVVVKVLPADLVGSVSIARFRREITLAARLQHPHIVPLIAAGEIDGLPYYTMPLVDGESLRARLAHGELPIAETISILRDVARALAYAHGKGVAHRDIKPDNVLLAGTSAVITDFGVAKALSEAAVGGPLTSVGVALGTPAYMAPEQAAADPATDLRADIYAFGVMAYEMLAGHAPFAGRSVQGILAAHATEQPTSIVTLRAATPASLANLVMRCLEKRPGDRPQNADELLQALEASLTGGVSAPTVTAFGMPSTPSVSRARAARAALAIGGVAVCLVVAVAWLRARAASAGTEIRSIAVLPFDNTSGDTTFDYLEDGITDHVRDALNAIPALTVKARNSSRQFKGKSAREIGAKLGVGAIVVGTVSRSGSRLHVTAELVRASDDASLWSSTFDGQPDALVGMQDTITRAVVGKLRLAAATPRADRGEGNTARGTADLEAYDLFLQGRHPFDRNDFERAAKLFRAAIARDPRFARAYGYLAMSYANAPTLGLLSADSMNVLARASAARALALDSTVAEAYVAESFVLAGEMRLVESLGWIAKAATLDSTNSDITSVYGQGLAQLGRVNEGLVLARRARDIAPQSGTAVALLSYALALTRQYDAALVQIRAALDLDPTNPIMHRTRGFYFAFNRMPDSAVASFETAVRLNPALFGGRSNLMFGYAAAGRWKDADHERAELERAQSDNSPHYRRMMIGLAYGDYAAAMTALEQGVARREALFGIMSIPCDQLFDPLKSNPRFSALMKQLGARACPDAGKWPIAVSVPVPVRAP